MKIVCSPVGVVDDMHPIQGIQDMVQAGFSAGVLDFSLVCSGYTLERYGNDQERMCNDLRDIGKFLEGCTVQGLQLPLAVAPNLRRDTLRTDAAELLPGLIRQCLPYCQQAGCSFLVVRP